MYPTQKRNSVCSPSLSSDDWRPVRRARRLSPRRRIASRDTRRHRSAAATAEPFETLGAPDVNGSPLPVQLRDMWAIWPRINLSWENLESGTATRDLSNESLFYRLDIERVRQVNIAYVRATFVRQHTGNYQVPGRMPCDRFSVPSVYDAKFVHIIGGWLFSPSSQHVPCPLTQDPELWIQRDEISGADSSARRSLIMEWQIASRHGLAIDSDDLKLFVRSRTATALENVKLRDIKLGNALFGDNEEFGLIPNNLRWILPPTFLLPSVLSIRYFSGCVQDRSDHRDALAINARFKELVSAEFGLRLLEGLNHEYAARKRLPLLSKIVMDHFSLVFQGTQPFHAPRHFTSPMDALSRQQTFHKKDYRFRGQELDKFTGDSTIWIHDLEQQRMQPTQGSQPSRSSAEESLEQKRPLSLTPSSAQQPLSFTTQPAGSERVRGATVSLQSLFETCISLDDLIQSFPNLSCALESFCFQNREHVSVHELLNTLSGLCGKAKISTSAQISNQQFSRDAMGSESAGVSREAAQNPRLRQKNLYEMRSELDRCKSSFGAVVDQLERLIHCNQNEFNRRNSLYNQSSKRERGQDSQSHLFLPSKRRNNSDHDNTST